MTRPPILILHAPGTNRDLEAAEAVDAVGGAPEIVPVAALVAGERRLADYRMLILPGGFSYGDDLGAGRAWALALRYRLREPIERFVASGRPVLGICNGFQVLLKAGLIPGPDAAQGAVWSERPPATLTHNASGRFECRWVTLAPDPKSPCVFTRDLDGPIDCPVAHGEGRLVARDARMFAALEAGGQVALRYVAADGGPAEYPHNPNGSQGGVAALCSPSGTVMGLMPHPEDHLRAAQHPLGARAPQGRLGARLFAAGLRYAAQV